MNVVLKKMLKELNVIGGQNGYLTSFSLNLMIIAFLQKEEILESQLSNLKEDEHDIVPTSVRRRPRMKKFDIVDIDYGFKAPLKSSKDIENDDGRSVGVLVAQFLSYFLFDYDSERQTIDI